MVSHFQTSFLVAGYISLMKVALRFEGTPGYKDFRVLSEAGCEPGATPEQIQDVVTFVGEACRLKDSMALMEGTVLNSLRSSEKVAVGDACKARLGPSDDMNPIPHLTCQVTEAQYRNYPIGGLCPPAYHQALVHFQGSTAGGETWHRRYAVGMECWPKSGGVLYHLNRSEKTIEVEPLAQGFTFPRMAN